MAKSSRPRRKRASAKRSSSSTTRTPKRASRSKRTKAATIQLKPIRVLIANAVSRLQRSDDPSIKLTVERLERCLAEFDAICDPRSKFGFGCGPAMTFSV